MIMVALKSMALSAICGAFLSAVTVGAASAGSSSAANPAARDCIKDCNDAENACKGNAGKSTAAKRACKRHYTNCVGACKF